MSSTAHFSDPDHFQSQSDEFMHWLAGKPGVQINPKIRLADLRSQAAGRGVGTFLFPTKAARPGLLLRRGGVTSCICVTSSLIVKYRCCSGSSRDCRR